MAASGSEGRWRTEGGDLRIADFYSACEKETANTHEPSASRRQVRVPRSRGRALQLRVGHVLRRRDAVRDGDGQAPRPEQPRPRPALGDHRRPTPARAHFLCVPRRSHKAPERRGAAAKDRDPRALLDAREPIPRAGLCVDAIQRHRARGRGEAAPRQARVARRAPAHHLAAGGREHHPRRVRYDGQM